MTTIDDVISTPGEILQEEFLDPLGISHERLAKAIHCSQAAILPIVQGKTSITPDLALRLSLALSTTPEFWLDLENHYQLMKLKSEGPLNIETLAS